MNISVFPKIGVGPPNPWNFHRVFHYFYHPFWGPTVPLFLLQHPYAGLGWDSDSKKHQTNPGGDPGWVEGWRGSYQHIFLTKDP